MDKEHISSDWIECFCKNKRLIISMSMKNILWYPLFSMLGVFFRFKKVTTLSLVK